MNLFLGRNHRRRRRRRSALRADRRPVEEPFVVGVEVRILLGELGGLGLGFEAVRVEVVHEHVLGGHGGRERRNRLLDGPASGAGGQVPDVDGDLAVRGPEDGAAANLLSEKERGEKLKGHVLQSLSKLHHRYIFIF